MAKVERQREPLKRLDRWEEQASDSAVLTANLGEVDADPVSDELPEAIERAVAAVERDPRVHGIWSGPGRLVVYADDGELAAAEEPATELGVDVRVVLVVEPPPTF